MEENSKRRDWESGKDFGRSWPRAGSGGDASWKPYAPEGVNGNNLSLDNVGREVSSYFRNKKKEYLKDKIMRDLYRGINEFKWGYQPQSNLVEE
jgi:hypothetical protein